MGSLKRPRNDDSPLAEERMGKRWATDFGADILALYVKSQPQRVRAYVRTLDEGPRRHIARYLLRCIDEYSREEQFCADSLRRAVGADRAEGLVPEGATLVLELVHEILECYREKCGEGKPTEEASADSLPSPCSPTQPRQISAVPREGSVSSKIATSPRASDSAETPAITEPVSPAGSRKADVSAPLRAPNRTPSRKHVVETDPDSVRPRSAGTPSANAMQRRFQRKAQNPLRSDVLERRSRG
ncbi:hypothetical protein NKR23_g4146 [Pleurostoma richardsiae]|uniref:Uncharacterized protein n=1 Tax=Pleurostoma richardsiae TaxID=41990 RepID=A0AA38RKL3_9PEZI|nr:hypothetical protein NKR23_g4146 [Pleurostoma richardsiae]